MAGVMPDQEVAVSLNIRCTDSQPASCGGAEGKISTRVVKAYRMSPVYMVQRCSARVFSRLCRTWKIAGRVIVETVNWSRGSLEMGIVNWLNRAV